MAVNKSHAFHRPRGKAALVRKPIGNTRAGEPIDLPKTPLTKANAYEFSMDVPENYTAVMRKDYFTDSYVIIAPKRHLRPSDFAGSEHRLVETAASPRLDLQEEVDAIKDRAGNWKTKVVDNKFPALTLDNPQAFGKQEIVIDTPLPNTAFGKLDLGQVTTVLQTYQKRTIALLKIRGIKYVTIFKNDGVRAGASLAHAHSQIFATPIVPSKPARVSASVEQYFQKHDKSPYDTVVQFEIAKGERIIEENEHFVAFCPFAARWPLDAWIVPKAHIGSIAEMDESQLAALASLLKKICSKLTKYKLDYNFYLENAVSPNHRFSLKVQARSLNWWAGFEVASDIAINPVPPEVAASWYRSAR